MNIFKTLASGSGRINEPNVSAFLGYLLNPKEDHGLGDAFLRRFLEPLLDKDEKDNNNNLKFLRGRRNLSIHSNFEFEVLLEQAFKDDNGENNQIVDIVILCYKKNTLKESFLAEEIIKQRKSGEAEKLKHIFLIENKIDDNSCTKGQLLKQFNNTITTLERIDIDNHKDIVSVIFVTPEGKNCKKEFEEFTDADSRIRLLWHTKKGNSISKMIKSIIEKESKPIDAYCKHTLQAFLEFIENGFKSTIEEESESKGLKFRYNDGIYTRPRLAQKLISDYVKKYEEDNKEKITFEKLRSALFPKKKWNPTTFPFTKEEDAVKADFRKDGTKIYDNYGYYPELLEIKDAKIRFGTGFSDENELQELLNKIGNGRKLDDLRIK